MMNLVIFGIYLNIHVYISSMKNDCRYVSSEGKFILYPIYIIYVLFAHSLYNRQWNRLYQNDSKTSLLILISLMSNQWSLKFYHLL